MPISVRRPILIKKCPGGHLYVAPGGSGFRADLEIWITTERHRFPAWVFNQALIRRGGALKMASRGIFRPPRENPQKPLRDGFPASPGNPRKRPREANPADFEKTPGNRRKPTFLKKWVSDGFRGFLKFGRFCRFSRFLLNFEKCTSRRFFRPNDLLTSFCHFMTKF